MAVCLLCQIFGGLCARARACSAVREAVQVGSKHKFSCVRSLDSVHRRVIIGQQTTFTRQTLRSDKAQAAAFKKGPGRTSAHERVDYN